MNKKSKKPITIYVPTSGWTEEERADLETLVNAEGTDTSKYIRKLVREAAARMRQDQAAQAAKEQK